MDTKTPIDIGTRLDGRYCLVNDLPTRSRCAAFVAQDEASGGQLVVVHLLPPDAAADLELRANLKMAVDSAATFVHAASVQPRRCHFDGDPKYYVSDYFHGPDLQMTLEPGERLDEAAAYYVIEKASAAVSAAHGASLVHGDLHPGVVHCLGRGVGCTVKVSGLGTAWHVMTRGRAPAQPVPDDGHVAYTAPEVQAGRVPDPRADVYGLAAILYRLLSGRPPFVDDARLVPPHPGQVPEALPGIVAPVNAALQRALSNEPERRFATVDEFVRALRERPSVEVAATGGRAAAVEPEGRHADVAVVAEAVAQSPAAHTLPPPNLSGPPGRLRRAQVAVCLALAALVAEFTMGVVGLFGAPDPYAALPRKKVSTSTRAQAMQAVPVTQSRRSTPTTTTATVTQLTTQEAVVETLAPPCTPRTATALASAATAPAPVGTGAPASVVLTGETLVGGAERVLERERTPALAVEASDASAPREGSGDPSFTNGLGMRLVWLPPGSFVMGGDDGPRRRILLTRGFWMAVHETTQRQFKALMGFDPSRHRGLNRPVDHVTWHDAQAFCRQLTVRERAAQRLPPDAFYTLPSEAQWEYACRAAGRAQPDEPDAQSTAWFRGNSGSRTRDVGSGRPNGVGLYDMLGNVEEWCLDRRSYDLRDLPEDGSPVTEGFDERRIVRGGSCQLDLDLCAPTSRSFEHPLMAEGCTGLRCAAVFLSEPSKGTPDPDQARVMAMSGLLGCNSWALLAKLKGGSGPRSGNTVGQPVVVAALKAPAARSAARP